MVRILVKFVSHDLEDSDQRNELVYVSTVRIVGIELEIILAGFAVRVLLESDRLEFASCVDVQQVARLVARAHTGLLDWALELYSRYLGSTLRISYGSDVAILNDLDRARNILSSIFVNNIPCLGLVVVLESEESSSGENVSDNQILRSDLGVSLEESRSEQTSLL